MPVRLALALAGAAALAALALPSAASAAYAPELEVRLDPAAPGAAAAIETRITQTLGETASQEVRVSFPAGFESNPAVSFVPCTDAQAAADACPGAAQVGSARARTNLPAAGELSGPVYVNFGETIRLIVYLRSVGGVVSEKLVGEIAFRDDGIDATFRDLPALPTTELELKLGGGGQALAVTPRTCAPLVFEGSFLSHQGERARSESTVEITGCPVSPAIARQRVRPTKFRTVRRASDRRRPGFGTTLFWDATQTTRRTTVRVERLVRRGGGRRAWRRVGTLTATGAFGRNRMVFDGRVRGRRLPRGRYRFTLLTENERGLEAHIKRTYFTIV